MCAPQEPPNSLTVVFSDIYLSDITGPFGNPFSPFGDFDNHNEDVGLDDFSNPNDNSFDLVDLTPGSMFDIFMAYEPNHTPIAYNTEPPPYSETSPIEWGLTEGGLSADGATYTPTFPSYDNFLSWSPPALRLEEVEVGLSTPYTPSFPAYDRFDNWSPPALRLEEVGQGLSTPYTPSFPAYDRLAPMALDAMFAPHDDNKDLLDALDALYEPEDESHRVCKRKIDFE